MKQALVFGEVLFDVFPNNKKVLGGAPFNVAWNLNQFGASPVFVSRIGNDENGRQILSLMGDQQLATTGVQIDNNHPTGTVTIEMSANTHQFNINADQAYDFIDYPPIQGLVREYAIDMLYFGTLAIRSPTSLDTLKQLLTHNIPAFVDVNLRSPWWDVDTVNFALDAATWAKVNDEELDIIGQQLFGKGQSLEAAADTLMQRFQLERLIVTCGDKGAHLYTSEKRIFKPAPAITRLNDTIGAGDAFSAVIIYGLLEDWPLESLLQRALDFAAKVCGLQGAVSTQQAFYQDTVATWNQAITT